MQPSLVAHRAGSPDNQTSTATIGKAEPASAGLETSAGAHISYLLAETKQLRADLDQVRGERDRLADVQRRVMELLASASAEKIIHDLRNVLNERELLRALVDQL
jgi:hypothetical protein